MSADKAGRPSSSGPQTESRAFLAWGSTGALDPEAQRINFSWLVRLRWGAVAGQLAAIGFVHYGMDMPLPLSSLAVVLAVTALFNLGCAYCVRKLRVVSEPMVAAAMAVDVVLLTLLLYFTGGPSNPFSFLYLVHIALAAVVLRSWWTWSLVALSLGCFAALFFEHELLGPMNMHDGMHAQMDHSAHAEHAGHVDHAGHIEHAGDMSAGHDGGMSLHLQGMWVAFGIAAAFIVYFVSRVTRDLAAREGELMRMRSIASRNEKLAALATLAAGAAHELSTPLSTIAVAAKELEQSLEHPQASLAGSVQAGSVQASSVQASSVQASSVIDDVRLIRSEVARCRAILQQLSVESGQSPGESAVQTQPEQLVKLAVEGLRERERIEQAIDRDARERKLLLPQQAVALALRGLLKNALQAGTGPVALHVSSIGNTCMLEVRDTGPGMPPSVLARVGEPFFTTKPPGHGMGLGVFVARALCEQLGGKLSIESTEGLGTTVRMLLPLELEQRASYGALRPQETT